MVEGLEQETRDRRWTGSHLCIYSAACRVAAVLHQHTSTVSQECVGATAGRKEAGASTVFTRSFLQEHWGGSVRGRTLPVQLTEAEIISCINPPTPTQHDSTQEETRKAVM